MPDRTFWPLPADQSPGSFYLWARRLADLMKTGKHVETVKGSVTLTAGTTSTVVQTAVLSDSVIVLTPTNSTARSLGNVAVTAKTQGTSFVLTTPSAVGTETFDYVVIR